MHNSDVTFDFQVEGSLTIHKNFSDPWKVTVINTGYETLTGERIKKIQPYTDGKSFLLTYGDGVCDVNINDLIKFHEAHGKNCTITAVRPEGRFGAMTLDGDRILSFVKESFRLRGELEKLLSRAKSAVEVAIERGEDVAIRILVAESI